MFFFGTGDIGWSVRHDDGREAQQNLLNGIVGELTSLATE